MKEMDIKNAHMRRSDRKVNSITDVIDILDRCDTIRLGINAQDFPYVVPMNFGLDISEEPPIIWLHAISRGLKLDLIKQNNKVGFQADCSHKLVEAKRACDIAMEYESVIGRGIITIHEDDENKRRCLDSIMKKYAPHIDFVYDDTAFSNIIALKLEVLHITGKALKKAPSRKNYGL